jgi:hypothetical protein
MGASNIQIRARLARGVGDLVCRLDPYRVDDLHGDAESLLREVDGHLHLGHNILLLSSVYHVKPFPWLLAIRCTTCTTVNAAPSAAISFARRIDFLWVSRSDAWAVLTSSGAAAGEPGRVDRQAGQLSL